MKLTGSVHPMGVFAEHGAAVERTVQVTARPSLWHRIRRANARLEDSLLGDLLGAACLFGAAWLGFIIGGVLQ